MYSTRRSDRIVWDVGHQTYPHKILTGRRDQMHDAAPARRHLGLPAPRANPNTTRSARRTPARRFRPRSAWRSRASCRATTASRIAVIGDGAMTAGMAFEAMNNAGVEDDVPLLVILNDNDMSISPPVGALNRHLARLMSGRFYAAARAGVERVLRVAPPMLDLARKLEEHAKGMIVPATLFEEFGFNYIGPIDGHDLDSLIPTLQNIKELRGPQFLHVVTKKGQGYKLAEADPVLYHGPGKFNPAEGIKPVGGAVEEDLHAGVRRMAVRRGRAGFARRRHHARDARRLGHGRVREALPGPLFRRRHRRAARGDVRRRSRRRRHETGRRDLFDVPATRLRSIDPRRRAAKPAGGVRHRPRRVLSAPMARRTRATTISRSCAASRT